MSESKHADLLRSLGFRKREKPPKDWNPDPPLRSQEEMGPVSVPVLKERPKAAVPMPELPWFVFMNGDTIVMDETRQTWELEGQELQIPSEEFNQLTY